MKWKQKRALRRLLVLFLFGLWFVLVVVVGQNQVIINRPPFDWVYILFVMWVAVLPPFLVAWLVSVIRSRMFRRGIL